MFLIISLVLLTRVLFEKQKKNLKLLMTNDKAIEVPIVKRICPY